MNRYTVVLAADGSYRAFTMAPNIGNARTHLKLQDPGLEPEEGQSSYIVQVLLEDGTAGDPVDW